MIDAHVHLEKGDYSIEWIEQLMFPLKIIKSQSGFWRINKMNNILELIKSNERLFFENAEELNDEEVEQEDIDEYFAIQKTNTTIR